MLFILWLSLNLLDIALTYHGVYSGKAFEFNLIYKLLGSLQLFFILKVAIAFLVGMVLYRYKRHVLGVLSVVLTLVCIWNALVVVL